MLKLPQDIGSAAKFKELEEEDMYGMQFMPHAGNPPGRKYSSFQFWRGRIKIVSVGA